MEENEMLEQTNDTENVDTQTTEEKEEGIELTDTSDNAESEEKEETDSKEEVDEEKKEVKKSLRELLEDDEDYQKEFTKMIQGRLDRAERKHEKEISKYRDTENVLRTTLKLKDGDDTNAKLREYYEAEGIKLPEAIKPGLSARQIEVLAKDEAKQIIDSGYDEMNKEANRLANIGYANLNESEKIIFDTLCETLTKEKDRNELLKLGAKEELLSDKSFNDFRNKFNTNVPINEIYDMYMKNNSKKSVKENPGSMKNSEPSTKKSYYTPEEIAKLTDEQLNDPDIWKAVRDSMTKDGTTNYYE